METRTGLVFATPVLIPLSSGSGGTTPALLLSLKLLESAAAAILEDESRDALLGNIQQARDETEIMRELRMPLGHFSPLTKDLTHTIVEVYRCRLPTIGTRHASRKNVLLDARCIRADDALANSRFYPKLQVKTRNQIADGVAILASRRKKNAARRGTGPPALGSAIYPSNLVDFDALLAVSAVLGISQPHMSDINVSSKACHVTFGWKMIGSPNPPDWLGGEFLLARPPLNVSLYLFRRGDEGEIPLPTVHCESVQLLRDLTRFTRTFSGWPLHRDAEERRRLQLDSSKLGCEGDHYLIAAASEFQVAHANEANGLRVFLGRILLDDDIRQHELERFIRMLAYVGSDKDGACLVPDPAPALAL